MHDIFFLHFTHNLTFFLSQLIYVNSTAAMLDNDHGTLFSNTKSRNKDTGLYPVPVSFSTLAKRPSVWYSTRTHDLHGSAMKVVKTAREERLLHINKRLTAMTLAPTRRSKRETGDASGKTRVTTHSMQIRKAYRLAIRRLWAQPEVKPP